MPRVRDRLKETVDSLTANGGTPTMEAYAEIARYMLGKNSDSKILKYSQRYIDFIKLQNRLVRHYLLVQLDAWHLI